MTTPNSRLRCRSLVAAAILTTVLVSGCGSSTHTSSSSSDASSSGFPVTIKSAGAAAKISQRPRRIVSLSPTATEDLFAIGAGSQVVAVDSLSTYPKSAPHTKLSAYHPNLEAIAKYRPDLVVIADDINHVAEQLNKLHVPVLTYPAPANLKGAYAQLEQLGRATGNTAGATREVARMRGRIAAIVRSVPRPSRTLTVYHELDQNYYSADSHTFIGQIYALFGLKNIADKAGKANNYPQLSAEYIIARNPDLIVLADTICCGQTPAKVAARPGWSHIAAVKDGTVVPVSDTVASEWGPQIVQFVKTIASAVRRAEARQHGGGP
jgi:iron complex transport system substrate-binding protein